MLLNYCELFLFDCLQREFCSVGDLCFPLELDLFLALLAMGSGPTLSVGVGCSIVKILSLLYHAFLLTIYQGVHITYFSSRA